MNEVEKSRIVSLRPEKVSGRVVVERYREGGRRRQARAAVVVGKKGRSVEVRAHSQILRIRAEDSRVGEDRFCETHFVLFSRHILPASPLGDKNAA